MKRKGKINPKNVLNKISVNSHDVLVKYLNNASPTRRDLMHWLVDLPFLIETSRGEDDNQDSFCNFYIEVAMPFVRRAIKEKYGFRDAVNFINYNVMNSIHGGTGLAIEMNSVLKLEEKNLRDIVKFLKKYSQTN